MNIWRNRTWPALLLRVALLSACPGDSQTLNTTRSVALDLLQVTPPANSGTNADLDVHLTVQRTVTGKFSVARLPVSFTGRKIHTDLFKMFVNGKSRGVVAIKRI